MTELLTGTVTFFVTPNRRFGATPSDTIEK